MIVDVDADLSSPSPSSLLIVYISSLDFWYIINAQIDK